MNKELQDLIDEANERIEALSDAGRLLEDPTFLEIFEVQYEPTSFSISDNEEDEEDTINVMFQKYGQGNRYYELEVTESFLRKYVYKLRRQCSNTNTLTFQEAEPEEYKEAKAAEEAMKRPDFKEVFEYSEDSKYDTNVSENFIRKAYDNQELWWQQQEE